ncbi:phenylalanine--tRNA ligase subunit beta [Rickettsia typhi]|uniref:Phenylalanine--tRNA ligase beta subunit n=2 Tax=Rickettsia typhi TaxID=785 RepID=SYFB_RICTY|nr:phenylalanine--tRNA ligase subunit beta [Rickettsia typhi]Q68WW1.1 RecName: Full=Phenylalanine--tRNA ligase beta subunit; AltName: Full=Phenylalanyl-tRNA synthetase beta subunit; Short=PheRS [Rickettsia typhi str. Wilmington]AAU03881.1 Phenylalanine translase [Rickettsia typhi str. Wilmington]AFE54263.1 phenylalanyl-tRNA synthetase subunit beta [Rickettsia typhi str. TH1527]AFE55103.1 phenylalanyl-tRNA synthetase subunit beta [Rickettsia typhi str. B9991CWPP]
MKFTLSWLKQFLEISASVTEIAEALTDIGLEVEEVIDKATELQKFEVAYIRNIKPHPSADKLKLCDVETKNGILQIVCGASNVRADIKVVLANIGIEIPKGNFKIKESIIRGEKSYGMLCSEEELLLSSDSNGIIELPEYAVVGDNFTRYYGLDDPIFVINVTPNRGDVLGVYGIARDLSAKGLGTLKKLELPEIKSTFFSKIKLNVHDKAACPLFTFREIRNLKNKPSPSWLQQLLKNVGIKTISSLVDITNYIAYSFGQPIHVYDADRIYGALSVGRDCNCKVISYKNHEIATAVLKSSNDTANFYAINGKEYLLTENDLTIKDESGIQGLAGIICGAKSSCNDSTINVILEAACFNARLVAASGRRLKIDTESRYRNERNIDRNFTEKALDIATNLILSICGNCEVSEVVKVGEQELQKIPLDFSVYFLEKITGIKLSIKEIEVILNKLGFITDVKGDIIKVIAPSWRHDINILEDIAEEIVRIYGYDKIESIKLPELHQDNNNLREYKRISSFKRILASQGYDEVVTNSFMSSEDAKLFAELKEELFLLNPMSIDENYMRPTVLPNLISIVSKNLARAIKDMAFFEVGPSFINLNTELTYLTAIISGSFNNKNPHSLGRSYDIFDIKGALEQVIEYAGLSLDKCIVANETVLPQYYHPTRAINIRLGKNLLGHFGQIHPKILKYYDINQEIFAFELNITNLPLIKAKFGKRNELKVSDFQANFRDYSFIVNQDHRVGEIISYINNFNKNLVKSVMLFDIYSGDKLPEGKKSISIKIELQADDRTLSETDLNAFSQDLVESISQKFQGTLRE